MMVGDSSKSYMFIYELPCSRFCAGSFSFPPDGTSSRFSFGIINTQGTTSAQGDLTNLWDDFLDYSFFFGVL